MKKLTLFIIILFLTTNLLQAQTNKGNMLIGVSTTLSLTNNASNIITLGYSSSKVKSDNPDFEDDDAINKTKTINFSPRVGVFIVDNLAIGVDLSLAYQKQEIKQYDEYVQETNLYGAGPFIRYYIPTNRIKPFIEINSLIAQVNTKSEMSSWGNDESTFSAYGIGAGIGMAIPIGTKATFDLLAGYNNHTVKENEDNEDNYRTVTNSLSLKFGFNVFLGRN